MKRGSPAITLITNIYFKYGMSEHHYSVTINTKDVGSPIISLEKSKTLMDARNLMLKYNISRIVITSSEKKGIGIVTEKDIAKFLYEHVDDKRKLDEIPVSDLLENKDKLLVVNKSIPIGSIARIMLEEKISSLIVVDEKGNAEKIVTKTDLVAVFAHGLLGKFNVSEYMVKEVITATPYDNIYLISRLMDNYQITRIVVVYQDKPVGIITSKDYVILAKYPTFDNVEFYDKNRNNLSTGGFRTSKSRYPVVKNMLSIAQDIMTPNPIVVEEDADVSKAAVLMTRHSISGLPVIDKMGNLTGIITKTDILKILIGLSK